MRISTGLYMKNKPGKLFSVNTPNGLRFFQYLGDDSSQLNSNLIAVFNGTFQAMEDASPAAIKASGVAFYAHVLLKLGLKLDVWKPHLEAEVISYGDVWFRGSPDYGNPAIKETSTWWLWRANQKRITIHGRSDDLVNSHVGVVVTPSAIVDRMESGVYAFFYPMYPGQVGP